MGKRVLIARGRTERLLSKLLARDTRVEIKHGLPDGALYAYDSKGRYGSSAYSLDLALVDLLDKE